MNKKLLCLILLFSCLRISGKTSQCEDALRTDINLNWKFMNGYYLTTQNFTNRLDLLYARCILMMKKQEIIDLFGEPTTSDHLSLIYVTIPICDSGEKDYSYWRYFVFFL